MGSPGSSSSRSANLPWLSLALATVFGLATLQAGGASKPLADALDCLAAARPEVLLHR